MEHETQGCNMAQRGTEKIKKAQRVPCIRDTTAMRGCLFPRISRPRSASGGDLNRSRDQDYTHDADVQERFEPRTTSESFLVPLGPRGDRGPRWVQSRQGSLWALPLPSMKFFSWSTSTSNPQRRQRHTSTACAPRHSQLSLPLKLVLGPFSPHFS